MKILGSFNTKLDEHELYDAIQNNGQGNAILIKKHWISLIQPMMWMLTSFIAFGLLIRVVYKQFYNPEYMVIFRILTISYFLVTCTRCVHSLSMILYNIKSQIKNKKGYIDTIYKNDFKEGRFENFLRHTFLSLGLQVLLMIVNSILSFFAEADATSSMLLNIVGVIINIGFIFLLYKVLDRIIDYEMDFNIFTTDQFILYRQHGFFKTESMNVATSTVKIVKESKSGFWGSLFNYGKVSIHPEGDLSSSEKAIELFYVPNTKAITKKLNGYIEKSKELMNLNVAS